MSDESDEYFTAEEEDEEDTILDLGFILWTSEDGTKWFLPKLYHPEDTLLFHGS